MIDKAWIILGTLAFGCLVGYGFWGLAYLAEKGKEKERQRDKDAKNAEFKILYDLGFLCGKHDGRHGDYGRPCHIAPDLDRLHWWNGYHDGLKWREEDKKLNGDFTE